MAKSKPKQLPNKKFTLNDQPDMEECVQDGWVVVKKQKVTIFIPPLPVTEQCVTPNLGGTPLQPIVATEEVDRITAPQPDPPVTTEKTLPLATTKPATIEEAIPLATTKHVTIEKTVPLATTKPITIEKTMPLAATKPVTIEKTIPKPVSTFSNPPEPNHTAKPGNPHTYAPNCRKTLGICRARKARKYCGNLLNGHMLVNPKMRALNLERKLQRAGGLNSWLVSLGLGQFVKLFRCKHIGKVQLANLTMKKLKDLGADAVGPRRKLMHAIDCLWSQDGSIIGHENSSRRERASEADQGGGYDVILMTGIPYSATSLQKLYALIKKCLKAPYGVLFVSTKRHYVGKTTEEMKRVYLVPI